MSAPQEIEVASSPSKGRSYAHNATDGPDPPLAPRWPECGSRQPLCWEEKAKASVCFRRAQGART